MSILIYEGEQHTTPVWDNIPEWAVFSLEYDIEEKLALQ